MKKILLSIVAVGLAGSLAFAAKKQPLKVLYVGGMTDMYYRADLENKDALVKERTEAFKDMLEKYFTTVTAINGSEYNTDMSKEYDVTILDGRPKALKPSNMVKDDDGNVIKYERAVYLPNDYDCATVTIGQIGEDVGRAYGSKNDWYCLCLDAQAHSWKKDHPIFKGPFKVKMTVETCPTPSDAYHYAYYHDGPMPETLPMWRVQTKGYKTDEGFGIGMVSRPWGYTDSPDAEYISSGVCAKTLDAVAIGRHGNFLHWGFNASPLYMTDEAKDVFANAVVHISKFKGKKPIARKFNDRIATREYLKEIGYLVTKASYDERMKSDREWAEQSKAEYKAMMAKKERGEKLSAKEQELMKYGEPEDFKPTPYESYVKRYAKNFFQMFGTDEKAYAQFFKDNYDYFYSEGFYNIFLDEDVKAWGIPNYKHELLDKAISSLEQGKETERATRVLARYTMADFQTPAEWRNWYETYKDKMFFTEAGGWKFLINEEGNVPGNDYFGYLKRVEENKSATTGTETSDANPVVTSVNIVSDGRDNRQLVVKFKIHPGYHIYAEVAGDDPYLPTAVNLALPQGLTAGDWKISRPGRFGETGTTIHEDTATYSCPLEGNGAGPITCTVSYQVCDAHICMPPVKKDLKLKI